MTSVYWEDVGARHASPMYSLFSSTLMSTSGCCRVSPLKLKLKLKLKTLSEPEFYADLVYKFKKLIGKNEFSFQFRKIIIRYKRIDYVMRQSACLVFNLIMVDNYASFFNCTPVGLASYL